MNKKEITITNKSFVGMSLLYLAIPVIIFFLGFLKIWLGILCTIALLGVAFLAFRDSDKASDRNNKIALSDRKVNIPVKFILILAVFSILITIGTGVGEYVWTTYDHAFRRATLSDLVTYKWPVIYTADTQTNPAVVNLLQSKDPAYFIYYFTYWLPAAAVGKVAGFGAANVALVLWNSIGIALIILGMCLYSKRATYAALFTFLCFSGLDAVPYLIYNIKEYSDWWWIEGYVTNISMISNINSLLNIYHQCIPCWLITLMIMMSTNNRSIGLFGSLLFPYSPWGTIGLLPLAIVKVFSKEFRTKKLKENILNIVTVTNLVPAALILFVFGTFYMTKSDATNTRGFTVSFFDTPLHFVLSYLALILVEVVPFAIILYKGNKKNPLFIASIITLLVLPFYKITEQNDFVMRGAMAALFVFCVMFTEYISVITAEDELIRNKKAKRSKKDNVKVFLISLIIVAMTYITYFMTAIVFSMTISNSPTDGYIGSFGNMYDDQYTEITQDQFFSYNYKEQFFCKYLSKK